MSLKYWKQKQCLSVICFPKRIMSDILHKVRNIFNWECTLTLLVLLGWWDESDEVPFALLSKTSLLCMWKINYDVITCRPDIPGKIELMLSIPFSIRSTKFRRFWMTFHIIEKTKQLSMASLWRLTKFFVLGKFLGLIDWNVMFRKTITFAWVQFFIQMSKFFDKYIFDYFTECYISNQRMKKFSNVKNHAKKTSSKNLLLT